MIDIFQGFNTGVVLYDLEKMRKSESFLSEINEESFKALNNEYQFTGTVGDQVNRNDETELRAFLFSLSFFSLPSKKKRHRIKREKAVMAIKKVYRVPFHQKVFTTKYLDNYITHRHDNSAS